MDRTPLDTRPPLDSPAPGSFWTGLVRGARCLCPRCGRGRLFSRYVAVEPDCTACGLETGAIRADDAPPYFTIFIVGHIVVPSMLLLEQSAHPPTWVHMAAWIPLTLALTFALLRPVKRAVIGAQWALRIGS